jgi:hypothetical protein
VASDLSNTLFVKMLAARESNMRANQQRESEEKQMNLRYGDQMLQTAKFMADSQQKEFWRQLQLGRSAGQAQGQLGGPVPTVQDPAGQEEADVGYLEGQVAGQKSERDAYSRKLLDWSYRQPVEEGKLGLGRDRLKETGRHNLVTEETGRMNANTRKTRAGMRATADRGKYLKSKWDKVYMSLSKMADDRAKVAALGGRADMEASQQLRKRQLRMAQYIAMMNNMVFEQDWDGIEQLTTEAETEFPEMVERASPLGSVGRPAPSPTGGGIEAAVDRLRNPPQQ